MRAHEAADDRVPREAFPDAGIEPESPESTATEFDAKQHRCGDDDAECVDGERPDRYCRWLEEGNQRITSG